MSVSTSWGRGSSVATPKISTWDVEMNVHFREVCIGTGAMDYRTYLRRLATLPGDVPLMIEHMKDAAEYDQSRRHLFKVAGQIDVSFGV